MPRLCFADALEFAVFQHAQELGLKIKGKLADFVEEQRAIRGVLEIACARTAGAGERAFAVAEERSLHKVGRNRGTIECEIGLAGPIG